MVQQSGLHPAAVKDSVTSASPPRIFLHPAAPPPSPRARSPPTAAGVSTGAGKPPSRRYTTPTQAPHKMRSHLSKAKEAEDVVVYAPVRMSLEEASRMGGREVSWR